MIPMYSNVIYSPTGEKKLEVYTGDLTKFDEYIDLVTFSAFYRCYDPVQGTLVGAIYNNWGIDVPKYAQTVYYDLRESLNIWLGKSLEHSAVGRLGCIEFPDRGADGIMKAVQAYFKMLDLAALSGVKMETIAMPLIGAGNQEIEHALILTPLVRECIDFLKRTPGVKRIIFVEYNPARAFEIATRFKDSYALQQETKKVNSQFSCPGEGGKKAFISYQSADREIADKLCVKLEAKGIDVWYAPRNVVANDYATAIVNAINSCTHFLVIVSGNTLRSQHVLIEIDLAFRALSHNLIIMPLKIDDAALIPAFDYYLSRQHWMDAHIPPLEQRLDEFVENVVHTSGV